MQWTIRPEQPSDINDIEGVIMAAFSEHPHSTPYEQLIVSALRAEGALRLSLVAILNGQLTGHIAFSPVSIDGRDCGWCGLAPVAVEPAHQRRGIGSALIRAGLAGLKESGARGCVVLGDPGFYGRFGFRADKGLTLAGVPAEYFQALHFCGKRPRGAVDYHRAFLSDMPPSQ